MTDVIPFNARRFKSAARHYLTGRPAYPPRLIAGIAQLCGLSPQARVLDLGCGPGQLALAFAPYVRSVLAVDPEPEMLALCQSQIDQAGCSNITLYQGSSADLDPSLGQFDLVVIGRAFHWMDRTATLRALDTMMPPQGAVVLFGDRHPSLPVNAWIDRFDEIVETYAKSDTGRAIRKSPNWVKHEAVLLASPFCQLERYAVVEQHDLSFERVVDRALSRSSTTRDRLGDRADEMIAELRQHLFADGTDAVRGEVVEANALIARRPTQAD